MLLACLMLCVQSVFSQQKTITGIVTDAGGLPLPGVSVVVIGTTNGTQTDFDGNYQIVVSQADELSFSYVGMITKTILVGDKMTLNISMEESVEGLNEVVVVGYGTQKRALVTGASVNVKGEAIEKLNTATPIEALQGVTPGVNITRNNGAPGAGTKVTIRGLGTIGNSNPLYIVDGVAVGNIDYLGASDIESIDVLKDAASSAIYGSRAANGVILVTTKQGRKNSAPQVSYSSYYGFQNIYKNLEPLNVQQYMYIMDEARLNDGLAPADWQARLLNNPWLNSNYPGADQDYGAEIWEKVQNGWHGTNWINEITNDNAVISNHAINIAGGGHDTTYSLGVNYFEQEGLIGGHISDAGIKRLTARMNTSFVLFKNEEHDILTIGENFTYTNTENRSIATGNIYYNDLHDALVQNPFMPVYWQGSFNYGINEYGFAPTLEGIADAQHNPVARLFYRHNFNNLGNKNNTIVGNVFAELQPIRNLKFRSQLGLDAWFGHARSYTPAYGLGNKFRNEIDGASQSQWLGNNYTWTTTLSYEKLFADHKINAVLGYEVYDNQINTSINGNRINSIFQDPRYAYLDPVFFNPATSPQDLGLSGYDWAAGGGGLLSYIGRVQYNYKEKYLLSATMRIDGSSNFSENNRWGYFPSLSAGWVLTNEDFLADLKYLDFLKLRASWGQNGNQSIDNFIYSSTIASSSPGYYFGDNKPISNIIGFPSRVPNPDVTWETSEQLNFGLDSRLLSSRLSLTLDWYKKTTKDWLVAAPIQGTFGAAAPIINGGDIENKGFEFSVGWNDAIGDFKYGLKVSGAFNSNKVTRIANEDGIIQGPSNVLSQGTAAVSRAQVGYPIGFFYGFKTDGLLQTQADVDAYVNASGNPYYSDARPGDVKFVDLNQDGVIDDNDKTMIGNPNPDFELGINLNAEFKGFYTNLTMAGKYGMQVMQSYRSFSDSPAQNYTTNIFNRWHGAGTSNRIPRLSTVSNRNINQISDIYVHNADYLRISNLTFGYSFAKHLDKIGAIKDIRVYTTVNNLYTFTNYNGMDPEVGYGGDLAWGSGIDLGLYPLPRTVMFGVNVDF